MAETTLNITDAELLQKLNASYIDAKQKKTLELLIPNMNETERSQLMALIDQAKAEKDKAEPVYQESLRTLNKEYTDKLNHLVKDETKKTYKEFEETEGKKDAEGLQEFETEIITGKPMTVPAHKADNVKSAPISKRKHGLRNIILLLLILALIAGGTLFALSHL